tara:strand:+ start:3067 stop:4434 length:1368 start_codon:yes stop_codon:yes gene_type:complete
MYNFGKSVNRIVIPELSEKVILDSVKDAYKSYLEKEDTQLMESLDFYYNQNLDVHLEQWFASDSLQQVPPFVQSCVPRFAKARMMLYKENPDRMIAGEINEDYKDVAYKLNTKTREFAELTWLLGCCWLKSRYDERKERLEYEVLPHVKEYYFYGESEPYGYSYEIEGNATDKRYVFWSEDREGVAGMHFEFDDKGKRYALEGNEDMVNPYGINPISRAMFSKSSYDVTRAALHIGIAMTEIALSTRFRLGQPVFTGIEEGQGKLKSGVDKALILPEGASFNYASPGGSLNEMIDAVKAMANQTAENNQLRIRWGESGGNAPSGEALRILEIENLEARKSDESLFREWEHSRYEIDRTILETHGVINLSEDYAIDFGEVSYPMSPQEERAWLDWKMAKGIMSKKDLLLYFNPDMTDEELEKKLGEVIEETQAEVEATQPQQPAFQGLRKLGTVTP